MEIALSPTTPGLPASTLVDLCRHAEGIGVKEAWLAEVSGPEAFSLLGAAATATSTLDLGVAIVGAPLRSAALLAMGAGTVSQLLEGRALWLGIGASSQLIVERWHGAVFEPAYRRVEETVSAVRALLAGDREFTGQVVKSSRFPLSSPPVGPVYLAVGALGPGMLRLAGAIGDGVCLNLMPPTAVPRQRAAVEEGARRADRELPPHFKFMARIHVAPTSDRAAGLGMVRAGFAPYFAQPVYNRFLQWLGYPEEAAAIAAGFAAGDREAVAGAFHDELVDQVAIVGDAAHIAARLAEYRDAGLDTAALSLLVPGAGEAQRVLEQVVAISS